MNPRDRTSYDVWRRNKRKGNQHRGQQPRSRNNNNNNNNEIIIRQKRILCTRLASRADPVSPISPHSRESEYWSIFSYAGESNQVEAEAVSGALLNAECARALPSIHSCRARFPPASLNVADSSLNEALPFRRKRRDLRSRVAVAGGCGGFPLSVRSTRAGGRQAAKYIWSGIEITSVCSDS